MHAQPPPAADLVLVNGTILTVDANNSVAQAVAVTGGKIVAVGSTRGRSGADRARHRSRRSARPDGQRRLT